MNRESDSINTEAQTPSRNGEDEVALMAVPEDERRVCWIAALAAARIPYRLIYENMQWQLVVPAEWAETAYREIREYERVNRDFPPPDTFPPKSEFPSAPEWNAGLLAAFGILLMDLLQGTVPRIDFVEEGVLKTSAVLQGDYARAVTALTLHGGAAHLLGNVLGGGLLISIAGGWLGTGMALFLVTISGILGNLTTVLVAPSHFQALGASTAIFGSLGLLTSMQIAWNIRRFGRRHLDQLWRKCWVAFAAAVGLLGLLGAGPQTDVRGHLFGFTAGILLGILPGYLQLGKAPRSIQWAIGIFTFGILMAAWFIALR